MIERLGMPMEKRDKLEAIILMGPFGSGKSYLGKRLNDKGVAHYVEIEPIVYELFGQGAVFDIEQATKYIRNHYDKQLTANKGLVAFESTGVVQRPLLLETIEKHAIALVRVYTPKAICLERVARRNCDSKNPIDLLKAAEFFDYWTDEIAPTYHFALQVDGTNEDTAIQAIRSFADLSEVA